MAQFEQIFKNIDNVLYRDSGCDSELDYTQQTSWVLFLKYIDEKDHVEEDEATLTGKPFTPTIEEKFRWSRWAKPKKANGDDDHHNIMLGLDLINFVNSELFPYLGSLKGSAKSDTLKFKIGQIFEDMRNKIADGYNLREIIDEVDKVKFRTRTDKHEMSELYESKIKNMGNAGRNGGQYYTPRPLIRTIMEIVDPKVGETVYDGAAGSAGFLCEAFDHMLENKKGISTKERRILENETFFGMEKKNLAYTIGMMNMILNGIENPNITHKNTLEINVRNIQEKDRHDVILANPPFGGTEKAEVKQNFNIKSSETAYLFLEHFIKMLKSNGRAGIVIKNTFLSNNDAAELRKHLLESCNLHTVLILPAKVFTAGVKTVVLFFKKGRKTEKIWHYELDPGRSLGKTNPLNDNDLAEFRELWKTRAETEKSWTLDISGIDTKNHDLTPKNPNTPEEKPLRSPAEIMAEMEHLDRETKNLLASIKELL